MNGFNYKGKSTDTIIASSRLILASFEDIDSASGVNRESVKGETTITRPIPNDYGTKATGLTFQYALVKENGLPFSDNEQIAVERWLTSPKHSSDLTVFDSNRFMIATYCGKFISTEWKTCIGGWSGVVFNFEHNNSYPKRHYEHTYNLTGNSTIRIDCNSDELEEYVYPVITLTILDNTTSVSITNITDESNTMTLQTDTKLPRNLPIIFDCLHCIPSDGTAKGIISYADLGWEDIGNIYWLRLIPGTNEIQITTTAHVRLTIAFDAPYKKVGGWMS